ncbi:MAG TPA: tetratricopeptide repeat protein [Nitrospiria bacterium]|nr:tetratricopeptide repeat protein [Candidatus Manganitrophaceae bacterium]HIL35591.1 tetratricopeptide repeat protein [Candidatus Manganitrophaceae bacterium]
MVLVLFFPAGGSALQLVQNLSLPSPLFEILTVQNRTGVVLSEEQHLFDQAGSYFDQGNNEEAHSSLEEFLFKYPNSTLLPDVYLLLSSIYSRTEELKRSIEVLKTFLDQFSNESRAGQVRLMLSDIYFDMEAFKEVFSFWNDIPGEEGSKSLVYEKLARAYLEREDYLSALLVLMEKTVLVRDPLANDVVRGEVKAIVQNKLDEDALYHIINKFKPKFPADVGMIRLIALYGGRGDYYRGGREIKRFVSLFPTHPFAPRARDLLDDLKDKIKLNRFLIGVILPLSGKLAPFGKTALNGTELALHFFQEELPGASVGLVVKDLNERIPPDGSRGIRDPFQAVIEDWLEEYRPIAVIGPLLSREVSRVAPIVERAGVALITPAATARRMTSLGKYVFRNAVTNRFLCRAIAEYAVVHMSLRYFGVFFPDERTGEQWVSCFSKAVTELGGEVVHAESYPMNNSDFSRAILRLKKADLSRHGVIEVVEELVETKEGELEEGEVPETREETLYIPGLDAIFLPGDARITGLIVPQLIFHGFEGVTLLGERGWNSPEFLKLVGPYAGGGVFVDGFFKDSPDPLTQRFVHEYQKKYHQNPDVFAAQAFDAVRIILTALQEGALSPEEIRESISTMTNFPAVSGYIYEVREGDMIKKPFFIEIKNKRFLQVN